MTIHHAGLEPDAAAVHDLMRKFGVSKAALNAVGLIVRRFAEELRFRKAALGRPIAIETGKIVQEALCEVQEVIDICGFAAGLSRQLYGCTIPSERPRHRIDLLHNSHAVLSSMLWIAEMRKKRNPNLRRRFL